MIDFFPFLIDMLSLISDTQCDQDNRVSNIVPIAVGAALGALVLVVLIAYLVGRKRNQRGYETVWIIKTW